MLDQLLRQEIRSQSLRTPTQDEYQFAEPDMEGVNIVHDADTGRLKGASVHKLVSLLTSHVHYDPDFAKTFLITYRSFCLPHRLLDLLIERFSIPEPPPTDEQQKALERGEIVAREDLKRFRREYAKPIQLKVLNVIRQWLEYHWYDFDREEKNAPTTTVAATFTPTTPAETTPPPPPPPTVAPDAPITPAVNAPVVTTNGESPEPQPPTAIDTIEQSPPAVAAEATPAVGPEPPATNKPPE